MKTQKSVFSTWVCSWKESSLRGKAAALSSFQT